MSGAVPKNQLSRDERLFYRDRLRAARYAALADSEGFEHVCFAVESLGMRLLGKQAALGRGRTGHEGYEIYVLRLADAVSDKRLLAEKFPGFFTRFPALYTKLRKARNDAMHTGAFARHATSAAIELCIHLEEAVMKDGDSSLDKVSDLMVREVVKLEAWHPVAHARQLMLTHSFSFLPVRLGGEWKLISEMSLACFLQTSRSERLAMSIEDAASKASSLVCDAKEIRADTKISDLFGQSIGNHGRIWLVTEADGSDRLLGILTPFELM